MTNTNQNPLSGYFRQTKISVKLPSGGKFYPEGFFELNNGDELDIKAMTAADELSLKNPDALLNGQGMVDIMKSCAPGIKGKAESLLIPDVSTIMLAIRHATYGDKMSFTATCPKCESETDFDRSIRDCLDFSGYLDDECILEFESGIKVFLKPHTFKTSTKSNIAQFEQSKIMQLVDKEDVADDAKLRTFSESFKKMVKMNFELICDAIAKVQTPQGQEVTKREFIEEFLKELSSKETDLIRDKIKELNETGIPTEHNCVCSNEDCKHEWVEKGIQWDPSHFFE